MLLAIEQSDAAFVVDERNRAAARRSPPERDAAERDVVQEIPTSWPSSFSFTSIANVSFGLR